jgi:four helix bundle protein
MFADTTKWSERMKKAKHPTSNVQHPTPNDDRETRSLDSRAAWKLREGDTEGRKYDLEERLLEFASGIIDLSEKLPNSRAGNHVAGQILRSGTSPYPNHGEAEDAESRQDFIHKLKVCLKELRETRRWARLISRKNWAKDDPTLLFVLNESDELIRIFFSSNQTAQRNAVGQHRRQPIGARYSSGGAA